MKYTTIKMYLRQSFLSNYYHLKPEIMVCCDIYKILKSINGIQWLFSDKKNVTMHGTQFGEKNIWS
jgi:hypothetical protein